MKDIVDRIFDLLGDAIPADKRKEAMAAVREEFGGTPGVPKRSPTERQKTAQEVLARFNGRNGTELARELGIGRATVYRIIKQPGKAVSN